MGTLLTNCGGFGVPPIPEAACPPGVQGGTAFRSASPPFDRFVEYSALGLMGARSRGYGASLWETAGSGYVVQGTQCNIVLCAECCIAPGIYPGCGGGGCQQLGSPATCSTCSTGLNGSPYLIADHSGYDCDCINVIGVGFPGCSSAIQCFLNNSIGNLISGTPTTQLFEYETISVPPAGEITGVAEYTPSFLLSPSRWTIGPYTVTANFSISPAVIGGVCFVVDFAGSTQMWVMGLVSVVTNLQMFNYPSGDPWNLIYYGGTSFHCAVFQICT
jgi:hypothetical protein